MKFYALIEVNCKLSACSSIKLRFVTDDEKRAYEELDRAKKNCASSEIGYAVIDTENLELSVSGAASISADYEVSCLEQTVQRRLEEIGVDKDSSPAQFEDLASSIAGDVYQDMIHYGTPENDALDEAMQTYSAEIEALRGA